VSGIDGAMVQYRGALVFGWFFEKTTHRLGPAFGDCATAISRGPGFRQTRFKAGPWDHEDPVGNYKLKSRGTRGAMTLHAGGGTQCALGQRPPNKATRHFKRGARVGEKNGAGTGRWKVGVWALPARVAEAGGMVRRKPYP